MRPSTRIGRGVGVGDGALRVDHSWGMGLTDGPMVRYALLDIVSGILWTPIMPLRSIRLN